MIHKQRHYLVKNIENKKEFIRYMRSRHTGINDGYVFRDLLFVNDSMENEDCHVYAVATCVKNVWIAFDTVISRRLCEKELDLQIQYLQAKARQCADWPFFEPIPAKRLFGFVQE